MNEEITSEEKEKIRNAALLQEMERVKKHLNKHKKQTTFLLILSVLSAITLIFTFTFFYYKQQNINQQLNQLSSEKEELIDYTNQLFKKNKQFLAKIDSFEINNVVKSYNDALFKIQIGAFKSPSPAFKQDYVIKLFFDEQSQTYKYYIVGFKDYEEANHYLNKIRNIDLSYSFLTKKQY